LALVSAKLQYVLPERTTVELGQETE